jgi:hypothetical protein
MLLKLFVICDECGTDIAGYALNGEGLAIHELLRYLT